MVKKLRKIESGSNMDGANMEGTKPNIKRVKLNSVNDSENAPEYPPRVSLGRKRLDWGKKEQTPTGKGGSGSMNAVGNFGAGIEKTDKSYLRPDRTKWSHAPAETKERRKGEEHPYVSDDPRIPTEKPKPPIPHTHKSFQKEDGGGGDGAFGDGGGTVFTSTNAGIFTPTHGDSKTRRVKSKKKRSGIEKLGAFLVDGSPEKKMKKTKVLKEWLNKQEEEKLPKFVEEGEEEEDKSNRVVAEQLDMENKISMINDEEKKKEDDNKPSADIASAHITDVQLEKDPMAFGNPQDDELKRGAKKDKSREESLELEKIHKDMKAFLLKSRNEYEKAMRDLFQKEDVPIKKKVVRTYTGLNSDSAKIQYLLS